MRSRLTHFLGGSAAPSWLRLLLLPVLVAMMVLGPGAVASQGLGAGPVLLEATGGDEASASPSLSARLRCHTAGDSLISFSSLQCPKTDGEEGLAKQLRLLEQLDEEDDLADGIASRSGLEGRALVAHGGPPNGAGRDARSRLTRPPRRTGA